jgi:hypothetical protein
MAGDGHARPHRGNGRRSLRLSRLPTRPGRPHSFLARACWAAAGGDQATLNVIDPLFGGARKAIRVRAVVTPNGIPDWRSKDG